MRVNVKLYATLRTFAPENTAIGESFPLQLQSGTISEAIENLGIPRESAKIVMVNGIRISDFSTHLKEDDLLVIFPPIGGG